MIGRQNLRAKKAGTREKFEGESSVRTNPALEQEADFSQLQEKMAHPKRERKKKNLEVENPSKISTAQTVFLFQIFNTGKLYVLKKTVNVLFHQ